MSTRPLVRLAASIALMAGVLVSILVTLGQIQLARAARTSIAIEYTVGGACGATIQACIDNPIVVNGDRILIPAGTYTESLTLNKAVSLIGADADTTIVHAVSGQRVMAVTGSVITASTIITGLTFTGGNLTGGLGCPIYCGGGLRIIGGAEPTLQNLVVANNHTDYIGGGIYADSKLTLMSTVVVSNTANNSGGGLAGDDAMTLIDTVFMSNSSPSGGGAVVFTATVEGSRFENNYGGGLGVYDYASIDDSQFISNTTLYNGGGLWAGGTLMLTNSVFLSNAAGAGGGLNHHPDPTFVGPRPARIVNTVFANNHASNGAALFLASLGQVTVLHTTIADKDLNGGTAIVIQGGAIGITDTIIVSHTIGITRTSDASSVYADYNLFFGNNVNAGGGISSGSHDVSGDPRFINVAIDDYHLGPGSAAIDKGMYVGVNTDLDGNSRLPDYGGLRVDIGAYEAEYQGVIYHTYLPVTLKNQ